MIPVDCKSVFIYGLAIVHLYIQSLGLNRQVSNFLEFYCHENETNLPLMNSELIDISKNGLQLPNSTFKYTRSNKCCPEIMHLAPVSNLSLQNWKRHRELCALSETVVEGSHVRSHQR